MTKGEGLLAKVKSLIFFSSTLWKPLKSFNWSEIFELTSQTRQQGKQVTTYPGKVWWCEKEVASDGGIH